MFLDGLFNGIGDVFGGLFGASDGSPLEGIINPSSWWDKFKNGKTNEVNKEIADENLQYQKDRNAIEDARYEEETAYNRAWAENQRDYERALQQQIFDREDTAIERQVAQLSKLGINPIGQNLNGLGAGAPVSATSQPGMSARGGQALHNDFVMQDQGLLQAISPIMSLANGVSQLSTDGIQRDSIRAERDYQLLKNQEQEINNAILANKNGISIDNDGNIILPDYSIKNQQKEKTEYENLEASKNRNVREDVFQETYGSHDLASNVNRIVTDAASQADRAVDAVTSPASKVLAESAKRKIKNYGESLKQGWENDKKRARKAWDYAKSFYNNFVKIN